MEFFVLGVAVTERKCATVLDSELSIWENTVTGQDVEKSVGGVLTFYATLILDLINFCYFQVQTEPITPSLQQTQWYKDSVSPLLQHWSKSQTWL